MQDEVVLLFDSNGVAKTIYTEDIELRELGKLYTYRASSVEFNNETYMWDVHLEDGTYVGSWESRQEAIRQEVLYLQKRMKE